MFRASFVLPLFALWTACAEPSDPPDLSNSVEQSAPAPLSSQEEGSRPLQHRAANLWPGYLARATTADAVFYGEVISIAYGTVDIEEGNGMTLPVTFVTYEVLRGIKGGTPGEMVTLRFLGGPVDDRHWSLASGIPLFDVGETDILMVVDNGATACPLVDCAEGRIRVIDERLYTDDGHGLRIDGRGDLLVGARQALPEVLEHDLAGHRLELRPSQPLSEEPEPDALEIDQFLASRELPHATFSLAALSTSR